MPDRPAGACGVGALPLRAIAVCHRWVVQLEEEFFRQGDVERVKGMSISPLFDRNQQGITKSQVRVLCKEGWLT